MDSRLLFKPELKKREVVLRQPKWEESLTIDWEKIFPLIDRILGASKSLGDCADLVEERLRMLCDGIRRLDHQAAEPSQPKD